MDSPTGKFALQPEVKQIMQSLNKIARLRNKIPLYLKKIISRRGKIAFLLAQKKNFTVIDIGCGNESPSVCKSVRPDCHYIGIDVEYYNVSEYSKKLADRYIIADARNFSDAIFDLCGSADAVLSSHNLEHCNNPENVLRAMCRALRPGGMLYMVFPCKESVHFPSRRGTLNFFDDRTHTQPPDVSEVLCILQEEGMRVEYLARRYRPLIPAAIGLLLEPISAVRKQIMPFSSTWALYGFEVVIWASRRIEPE